MALSPGWFLLLWEGRLIGVPFSGVRCSTSPNLGHHPQKLPPERRRARDYRQAVGNRIKAKRSIRTYCVLGRTCGHLGLHREGGCMSPRASSPASSTPSSRSVPLIPLLLLCSRTSLPRINDLILSLCFIHLFRVAFGECQEVAEEPSISVDFQSPGRGVFTGLLDDVHLVWAFAFPQSRRGWRMEVFQLPPKPIQRRQNVTFVSPLFLPLFVPPSPHSEQTTVGVFRELLFQIGLVGFCFLFGVTGVGIIRIPTRAFREFANIGFELLNLDLFFRPVYTNVLAMVFGKSQSGGTTDSFEACSFACFSRIPFISSTSLIVGLDGLSAYRAEIQLRVPQCKGPVLPLRELRCLDLSPLEVLMRCSSRSLVLSLS